MSCELNDLIFGYAQGWSSQPLTDKVSSGSIVFVCGPNGSGKSTLLRTVAGLLEPQAGKVHFSRPNDVVFLPNSIRVQPGVRVMDLAEIFLPPRQGQDLFMSNLERWNLLSSLKICINDLSSGGKQRAFLAAIMAHPASYILLDEPLSYLEWHASRVLADLVKSQQAQGKTFLISNHDLNWTAQFDRASIWLFDQGQREAAGPVRRVLESAELQRAFRFRTQLADNPLDHSPLLAIAPDEKN